MSRPLTDNTIKALAPPPSGFVRLWDASLPGFGIRKSQTATSFIVLIASGRYKVVGRYPLLSLSEARQQAKRLLAAKTLGKTHPTFTAFDDALSTYLDQAQARLRPKTYNLYRRLLKTHYPFGRQNVADITPRQIVERLNRLSHVPSEREHAARVGRTFFTWCVRQYFVDRSPMEQIAPVPSSASRTRVLAEDEIKAILKATESPRTKYETIVRLLLFTAQRPREIANLQWGWIEGDACNLPAHIVKNKRAHQFPLGEEAQHIIAALDRLHEVPYLFPADKQVSDRTTVFNAWGKNKVAFDKKSGVHSWQLRDLRRTVASNTARLGVDQLTVEKLLNHSVGIQTPIAAVYNRYSYMDEMKSAVSLWNDYLERLAKS